MSPGDLNSILLLKIMKRLGDLRSEYTKDHTTRALFDLVPEVISGKGQEHTIGYLYQHLLFLQGCGLVLLTGRFCRIGLCMIELTAQGNMFVQPELAEFKEGSLLPQVVDSIEKRVRILSYPDEEKDGMIFRLREAIAKQAPDVFAKVITEIGLKIAGG